jgi:hypothetical protein
VFQAKKTNVITLKTLHLKDPEQIRLVLSREGEEEVKFKYEVEQLDNDLWQVSVTPLEEGNTFPPPPPPLSSLPSSISFPPSLCLRLTCDVHCLLIFDSLQT